mgnify:CR=1 FL=1
MTQLPIPTDEVEYQKFLAMLPDKAERLWMKDYYESVLQDIEADRRGYEEALYEIEKDFEDGHEPSEVEQNQISFIQSCQSELSLPAHYVLKILKILHSEDVTDTAIVADAIDAAVDADSAKIKETTDAVAAEATTVSDDAVVTAETVDGSDTSDYDRPLPREQEQPVVDGAYLCHVIIDFSPPELAGANFVRINGERVLLDLPIYLLFFVLCFNAKIKPGENMTYDEARFLMGKGKRIEREMSKLLNELRKSIHPYLGGQNSKHLIVTDRGELFRVSTHPANIRLDIQVLANAGDRPINQLCKALLSLQALEKPITTLKRKK